ncbi:hypothetical protein [Alkaliphilus serpentinus]|uniref:Uncharacterized protein n=1 Tax=Alkaliphilus serpentinus TaxID=1482731 RepID=A0A833HMF3_9FIRM|nr:hypothetical protein [Alkaliphilus serpentinus]KAB3527583.1 hypothetical protein F8153_11395 [Alkaliphilus serpentinus]
MKKLLLKITTIGIILISLSFSLVFAGFQNEESSVKVMINYGEEITSSNKVILNLLPVNIQKENIASVEFSLDNHNWRGYNPHAKTWESNYKGAYQEYYTAFDIGETEGLVRIYVRIKDIGGKVSYGWGEINYTSNNGLPTINHILANEMAFSDKAIKQSGESFNPFIISSNDTVLILKTSNTEEISYSIDGREWSEWHTVSSNIIDLKLSFDGGEGKKLVYIRSRNQHGIEGSIYQVYYLIDKTKPQIEVSSHYHSLIHVNGRLEFDLSLLDLQSEYIDYMIEVHLGYQAISEAGRVKMYIEGRATTTSISVSNLPDSDIELKITAIDEAGNKEFKTLKVPYID